MVFTYCFSHIYTLNSIDKCLTVWIVTKSFLNWGFQKAVSVPEKHYGAFYFLSYYPLKDI